MYNRQDLHQAAYLHASGGKSIGPDWQWVRHFDALGMPYLTDTMLKHGFSETEVRGVLGENIMRVAKQVWK
jgi:microsomal dipeptidase-like Zn-dependent dipeptidase